MTRINCSPKLAVVCLRRLTLLQKEQGAFELKKVQPLDVNKVKDRSLVTVYEGSESKQ
jgi:hypothetical protein